MRKFKRLATAAGVCGLALGVIAAQSLGAQSSRAAAATGTATNWTNPGGAHDESGFSRLTAINKANVSRLGLAWSLDLPGEGSLEATPSR
jgi:quinohemoprotein ethanol dehydrogenase